MNQLNALEQIKIGRSYLFTLSCSYKVHYISPQVCDESNVNICHRLYKKNDNCFLNFLHHIQSLFLAKVFHFWHQHFAQLFQHFFYVPSVASFCFVYYRLKFYEYHSHNIRHKVEQVHKDSISTNQSINQLLHPHLIKIAESENNDKLLYFLD